MLLRLSGISRSFGSRTLFRGVELEVRRHDRIALVGPNGAGKTTLLRIAAGLEAPDDGNVTLPRGARVGLLRQELDPGQPQSVRAEVATALATLDAQEQQLRSLEARMTELGERGEALPDDLADHYDLLQTLFTQGGGFEREARIERVLAGLGFDEAAREGPLSGLSGGWLMRVELAKLLVAPPDVLLLDEPTNHLDLPSIQWFEETLDDFPGAVVAISHDRRFLRRNAQRVAAFESEALVVYDCGFDTYGERKARRQEELRARKKAQDREIAQTERFVERFRAKASKARQVQSRVKTLAKLERVQLEEEQAAGMRLRIPEPSRAGRSVLRLEAARKSYGDTQVYDAADFELERGERVALVGPNGAGKSTLLRLLAGSLALDAGERIVGHRVEVAFYAQHQLEALTAGRSVIEELASVARFDDQPRLRGHLGAFLFSGDAVDKPVSVLSGGEKARLALAKMLLRPTNCLVMDEPTNHLDLVAREILERALAGYKGSLVFISHDRSFIDAVATRVVEVKAGQLRSFPGHYSDYQRKLAEQAAPAESPGSAAPAPRRGGSRSHQERKAARRERERLVRRTAALEGEVEVAERGLAELDAQLLDPAVHADGDAMRRVSTQREAVESDIARLTREWETHSEALLALEQEAEEAD